MADNQISVSIEADGTAQLLKQDGLGATAGLTTIKPGGTLLIAGHPASLDSLSESITLAEVIAAIDDRSMTARSALGDDNKSPAAQAILVCQLRHRQL